MFLRSFDATRLLSFYVYTVIDLQIIQDVNRFVFTNFGGWHRRLCSIPHCIKLTQLVVDSPPMQPCAVSLGRCDELRQLVTRNRYKNEYNENSILDLTNLGLKNH